MLVLPALAHPFRTMMVPGVVSPIGTPIPQPEGSGRSGASAFRRISSGSVHRLLWCRNDPELLQDAEIAIGVPGLRDLAVGKPEQLQPAHRDPIARRRHARQVARMRAVVGPAFQDLISLAHQLISRDVQVRAAGEERAQRLLESLQVAYLRQGGIMVHIAGREELVSTLDVALVVELLGHAADDGLVFLRRHGSLLLSLVVVRPFPNGPSAIQYMPGAAARPGKMGGHRTRHLLASRQIRRAPRRYSRLNRAAS